MLWMFNAVMSKMSFVSEIFDAYKDKESQDTENYLK